MMFKIFVAVFVVAFCLAQLSDQMTVSSDRDVDEDKDWEKFKSETKKKYSKSEETTRKAIFSKRRKNIIANNNDKSKPFKMAINKFADWTDAELAKLCGVKMKNKTRTTTVPSTAVPAGRAAEVQRQLRLLQVQSTATTLEVDYRNDVCMQPVKDQVHCASCWAFSSIALVEFNYCVKNGNKPVALSEQQLVDCSTANNGCNGGWRDRALMYIATNGKGSFTEASYPYISIDDTCTTGITGATISTTNPVTYIRAGDIATMKAVLDKRQLVTVDIAVVNSFFGYSSGVYFDSDCNKSYAILDYHSITIVGYGTSSTGINYWIIRNSWGTGWGQAGYGLFLSGVNHCDVETFPMATTV